jgi:hypothetical protein
MPLNDATKYLFGNCMPLATIVPYRGADGRYKDLK